jgi:hypothetical protein
MSNNDKDNNVDCAHHNSCTSWTSNFATRPRRPQTGSRAPSVCFEQQEMSDRRLPGVANKVLRRRILRSERQIIPATLRKPNQRSRRESPDAATASDSAQASPMAAGTFGSALSLSYADAAGLCSLQRVPATEPAAEVAWSNLGGGPFAGAWPKKGQGMRPSLHAPLPDEGACPREGSMHGAVSVDARASASQVDPALHFRRGHELPAAPKSPSSPRAQGSASPSAARALRTPAWPSATSWHAPGHMTPPSAPTPACASYLPSDGPGHGLGIFEGLILVDDRSDLPAHHGPNTVPDYSRDYSLRAGTPEPLECFLTSFTDWERVTSAEDRAFARLLSGGVFWSTNEYESAPDEPFLPRPWNMCSTNL